MIEPLFKTIAGSLGAMERCRKSANYDWAKRHVERLEWMAANYLPSGSGIDQGTKIELDESSSEKIVLSCSYHHMDDNGHYDGWTQHKIIVTASLETGLRIRVTGRDRNGIKEYLGDTFSSVLTTDFDTELFRSM